MIKPVEFSLSSYWHIALAIDQEKPHGKPNQHQTMFTLLEVQARIASQWRLVTIFTIITIILHFLNRPTIGAYADGSHLHNQQQPSSPNLKIECRTNPYKSRLDCCLQHKKFQGSKLWWHLVSLGEGHLFRQGSYTEMPCLSSYNLLKMHVHIFTCKFETTKPWKAKLLWPPSFLQPLKANTETSCSKDTTMKDNLGAY
jgi:hypothetical protein